MSSQRYKRDDYIADDNRQRDRRHRSRSVEHHRRRRRSRTRSRSRSRGYSSRHDKRYTSRRHRDPSKSRSRSKSRSKHYTHSRTPTRSHRNDRRTRSRSSERYDRNTQRRNIIEQNASDNSKDTVIQTSSNKNETDNYLENLPLPNRVGAYYNLSTDEPIDKERIHREMEEKLRQTLAKEGKIYPPPKPEASHPVFANDGSFLEIFKKMQAAQQMPMPSANAAPIIPPIAVATPNTSAACYVAATAVGKSAPPPPPIVGRRRGGKILKTGVVEKPKLQSDANSDPKDFWSLYLAEVNKYKNNACESESGNRPLVK